MTGHIGRREFITLLGGAAAWPLAARAQQPAKATDRWVLGRRVPFCHEPMDRRFCAATTRTRLDGGPHRHDGVSLGGRQNERAAEIAAEFVRLKVDVMVAGGTPSVVAAKHATSIIPIVFAAAGDPVASNLVASLAQPGGNVTGLSLQQTDLAAKRLELLRELVPNLGRLAIMANVGSPGAMLEMGEAKAPARTLGWAVDTFEIRRPEDIEVAFETLKGRAEALYVCGDPLLTTNRIRIITWAMSLRVPTIYNFREYVESGGLMSYGPNLPDLYRRAGDYVDKILRGTKPGDIPVEQPSKFDLIINLTTAKALGLMTPESFLLRADEVIE